MNKVAIVYWSGTGNTEEMANALLEDCKDLGAEVQLYQASEFNTDEFDKYESVAFGCPAMGDEELEEEEFLPMYESIRPKLSGKPIVIFGSYSWNDGEWMRLWQSQANDDGANLLCDGIIAYEAPDAQVLESLSAAAKLLVG